MGRKPRELKIVLKKHYVPLPPEMVAVRRAGLLLLWQLIKAEIEKENADEYLGFGVLGNGNRNDVRLELDVALLALVSVMERIEIVLLRVRQAIRRAGLDDLLSPAVVELERMTCDV